MAEKTIQTNGVLSFGDWPVADTTVFPEGFFDIGLKTFLEVYKSKTEFVDFIILVDKPSGLFKSFQDYCRHNKGLK